MRTDTDGPAAAPRAAPSPPLDADLAARLLARLETLERETRGEGRDHALERLFTFVDAVFAIALTLLALDLRLPEAPAEARDAGLVAALVDSWPRLLSYATGFLNIAIFWAAHHRTGQFLRRADGRLVWLALLTLALVSFLPFPIAVLGQHLDDPVALTFFYGAMIPAALSCAATWWYATAGRRLVAPDLPQATIDYYLRITLLGALLDAIMIGVNLLGVVRPAYILLVGYLFGLGFAVVAAFDWDETLARRRRRGRR